jgi:hypothetical protein
MKRLFPILAVALLFGFAACDSATDMFSSTDATNVVGVPSSPTSDGGIIPLYFDQDTGVGQGNSGVNEGLDYCAATYPGSFAVKWDNIEGDPFELTYDGITMASLDGIYLSWSAGSGIFVRAVAVKGGPGYNSYVYPTQLAGDSGLASPPNASGGFAELSNVVACYTLTTTCEWVGETAWSAGLRYVNRGNWATFTPYDGSAKSVTLFAGQTYEAGTVAFSAVSGGMVTITITLNSGFRFEDVEENVKIQGYASAPSGNPSPGLFEHKYDVDTGESSFQTTIPQADFYGVHVNVEREVCQS